jgi:hypothetical protein
MALTVLKNTPIQCVVAVSGAGASETIDLSSTILTGSIKTFNGASAGVVSTTNDTLVITTHGFSTGDKVVYSNGGGTDITGLTNGTAYFVVVVDVNTIKLSATYGDATSPSPTAVDITALGVGTTHQLYKGQYPSAPVVNITGIEWSIAKFDEFSTVTRNSTTLWTLSGSNNLHFPNSGYTDNRQNTQNITVVIPATGGTVVLELNKISGYGDSAHLNQNR